MNVLVIDDAEEVIEAVISFTLQWRETKVIGAIDGETGLDLIEREHPNVVLLDVMMPGMDGYDVLRRIRLFSDVPVIMLTAKNGVLDTVKGLELGADDYVTKPFDHLELLARVNALMRRLSMPHVASLTPSFMSGRLAIDFARQEVSIDDHAVSLTPVESKVLYHLVRNAGHILQHETLLAKVWGREYTNEIDYLRVYICRLRVK